MVPTIIGAVDEEHRINIGELVRRKKVELAEPGLPLVEVSGISATTGLAAQGHRWPRTHRGARCRGQALFHLPARGSGHSLGVQAPVGRGRSFAGVQREWTARGLSTIKGSVRADGTPAWNRKPIRTPPSTHDRRGKSDRSISPCIPTSHLPARHILELSSSLSEKSGSVPWSISPRTGQTVPCLFRKIWESNSRGIRCQSRQAGGRRGLVLKGDRHRLACARLSR